MRRRSRGLRLARGGIVGVSAAGFTGIVAGLGPLNAQSTTETLAGTTATKSVGEPVDTPLAFASADSTADDERGVEKLRRPTEPLPVLPERTPEALGGQLILPPQLTVPFTTSTTSSTTTVAPTTTAAPTTTRTAPQTTAAQPPSTQPPATTSAPAAPPTTAPATQAPTTAPPTQPPATQPPTTPAPPTTTQPPAPTTTTIATSTTSTTLPPLVGGS